MTEATPDISDLPALVTRLTRQVQLYEALLSLADRQRGLIDAGQAEDLLTLLAQRQKIINEIAAISGELEPYRSHWDAFWATVPADQRPEVTGLIQRVQAANQQIAQRDDEDRRTLAQAKEGVGAELRKTSNSNAAMHALAAGA